MITQSELKSLLHYFPDTGLFAWNIKPSKRIDIGATAGCLSKVGYVQIKIDGKLYYAHRLAWIYMFGEFPDKAIDHINGVKKDNRIINLRLATKTENGRNQGKMANNASGIKGVCWYKPTGKWKASASLGGKTHNLGYFLTKEEASIAYETFAKQHHGKFYCHLN